MFIVAIILTSDVSNFVAVNAAMVKCFSEMLPGSSP